MSRGIQRSPGLNEADFRREFLCIVFERGTLKAKKCSIDSADDGVCFFSLRFPELSVISGELDTLRVVQVNRGWLVGLGR